MSKPFWQSKTLWFNVIGAVIVLLQYLGTIHTGDPKIIEIGLAVGNFILRILTDQPVTLTK